MGASGGGPGTAVRVVMEPALRPIPGDCVRRVLRRAGLAESLTSAGALYRSAGPDDVVTYSNLPPRPRR